MYSPREIAAYVAEGLKYFPTGPVAAMLKALKWGLGTNDGPTPLDFLLKGTDQDRQAPKPPVDSPEKKDKDEKKGSFGGAYGWAKENWEDALQAVWDYLRGVGPAIVKPTQATYPTSDEIARRLGTTRDDFHDRIKEEMKSDFRAQMKKIGNPRNVDIGVDRVGNIVLKNKLTRQEINTGVPLKNYAK